jgi:hypothetical protein
MMALTKRIAEEKQWSKIVTEEKNPKNPILKTLIGGV